MNKASALLIPYGHFLFRYRNYLFPLVLLSLVAASTPMTAGLDRYAAILGTLLVLLGEAIRASVIGLVYIKRGGVNKRIHADRLVTTGMFNHCRNPLYVGNLVILGGFLVTHNNPWTYVLGGVFFLLSYYAVVLAEEAFLADKFGDEFEEYRRRVPRWGFTRRGLGRTFRATRFSWKRVITKDYSTIMTWLVFLIVLHTDNRLRAPGQTGDTGVAVAGAAAALLVIAMAFGIRMLKKRGLLREDPVATEN